MLCQQNRKQYIVGGLLSGTYVFVGSLLAPVEIRFVESLTESTGLSGLVFGIASLLLTVASLRLARLSNRIGRSQTLLIGGVFGIFYAITYATVTNTLGLVGVKFAWAVAAAATSPIIAAYIQTALRDSPKKGRYFGYLYSIQSIAGSGGALLGGYLFQTYGFAEVALAVAAGYVFGLVVTVFLPSQISPGYLSKDKTIKSPNLLALAQAVFRKPTLRFYFATNVSFSLNWGVKAFLWPLVIISLGGDDLTTGSIFATMGLVAFLLLPFAGSLSDRYGPYRILLFELLLAGSVLAITGDLLWFWIATAFYTVGEVLNGPAQASILTEELPEEMRSEAIALDTSFDQILAFTAPLAAGVLASFYSPQIALGFFIATYAVTLLLAVKIFREARLS